jgi:hypothetical protein
MCRKVGVDIAVGFLRQFLKVEVVLVQTLASWPNETDSVSTAARPKMLKRAVWLCVINLYASWMYLCIRITEMCLNTLHCAVVCNIHYKYNLTVTTSFSRNLLDASNKPRDEMCTLDFCNFTFIQPHMTETRMGNV